MLLMCCCCALLRADVLVTAVADVIAVLLLLLMLLRSRHGRIAIHQAVVPKIDEATKEDLGIETIDTTPFAMFGVFDGHGGPACAEVTFVHGLLCTSVSCIKYSWVRVHDLLMYE